MTSNLTISNDITEQSDSVKLNEHMTHLLDQANQLIDAASDSPRQSSGSSEVVTAMAKVIAELREEVLEQHRKLTLMSERSDAMARAQAEAIVHSAEIIDELEHTRQRLSNARSAAERDAQDTQRLAETIFERTHDAVLVFNQDACIACNDNAIKLLGCVRLDIIGHWPAVLDSAEDESGAAVTAELRDLYAKALQHHVTSQEVRLWKSSEHSFWAEVTMSAFNMQDGGHVLMVVRDITARKQFEAELRRHRDFLNNIINAVPDQLSVKSPNRTLVVANDAFCRAHGIERDEVVGFDIDSILPSALSKRLSDIEDELLTTGHCKTTEH